jgi:hypothetical protein
MKKDPIFVKSEVVPIAENGTVQKKAKDISYMSLF